MDKLVWWVPETQGGIVSYSKTLWHEVTETLPAELRPAKIIFSKDLEDVLKCETPVLIHIQHEYGLFGRKVPGLYRFPEMMKLLRKRFPETRIVATAHTVISDDFRYPLGPGTGSLGKLLRAASNKTWVPFARKLWQEKTWGVLDGVIVHSVVQSPDVRAAASVRPGKIQVAVIPHFVPVRSPSRTQPDSITLVLFGYFSVEKGQDIAIQTLAKLPPKYRLILAGGVRRPEDQAYFDRCARMIRELNLNHRVEVTGYIQSEDLDAIFEKATLVLAPFRSTSGSGSLVEALARGKPVLASDLLLNRDVAAREPGCLECFQTESPEDGARMVERLTRDPEKLRAMGEAALRYASHLSPQLVAQMHVDYYRRVLAQRG